MASFTAILHLGVVRNELRTAPINVEKLRLLCICAGITTLRTLARNHVYGRLLTLAESLGIDHYSQFKAVKAQIQAILRTLSATLRTSRA